MFSYNEADRSYRVGYLYAVLGQIVPSRFGGYNFCPDMEEPPLFLNCNEMVKIAEFMENLSSVGV